MSIRQDAGGSDPASQVLNKFSIHLYLLQPFFREGIDLASEPPWEGSAGPIRLPRWPK